MIKKGLCRRAKRSNCDSGKAALEIGMSMKTNVCGEGWIVEKSGRPLPSSTGTLGPDARSVYRDIELYSAQIGIAPPKLISTCRSAEHQRHMQIRWDAGDRVGLGARPADPENSRHVPDANGLCWAFDLGNNSEWLRLIGPWVQRTYPNARWGGSFMSSDPAHIDVTPGRNWISAATWQII